MDDETRVYEIRIRDERVGPFFVEATSLVAAVEKVNKHLLDVENPETGSYWKTVESASEVDFPPTFLT